VTTDKDRYISGRQKCMIENIRRHIEGSEAIRSASGLSSGMYQTKKGRLTDFLPSDPVRKAMYSYGEQKP